MAIQILCECGRKLQIQDKFAGQQGRCPACGRDFLIPAWETETPGIQAQPSPAREEELPEALPAPPVDKGRRDEPERDEPVGGHADERLPHDADFFVPAPREIGSLNSAHTTLRKNQDPWDAVPRTLLTVGIAAAGFIVGLFLDLVAQVRNPLFIVFWPIALAVVAMLLALHFTRFRHTCTYVGRNGVARFVCNGSRKQLKVDEIFLFEEAIDLRTAQTRRFVNGVYQGTDYSHTWTDVGGRTRYVLKGTYRAKDGRPAPKDPFHFALAAEHAWTVYLVGDALRQMETNGWVAFRLGGGKVIRLGERRLQFHWGDKPERWEDDEVGEAVIHQGVVKIKHADAKEGWFSSQGVYKFNFSELANARLFFHLMEKIVQCPVR